MKSKKLSDLKVGDNVWHGGDSGFCHSSIETIVKIETKFDENTGVSYNIGTINSGQKFDMRTGRPKTTPWAYYIKTLN